MLGWKQQIEFARGRHRSGYRPMRQAIPPGDIKAHTSAARISPGTKSEVSSCVSVGAWDIRRPPRRGSMMNDQNMLTPAAIAGQLSEGWVRRWTRCSTRQWPKAEAPTLADGIWQSQSITTARITRAITIVKVAKPRRYCERKKHYDTKPGGCVIVTGNQHAGPPSPVVDQVSHADPELGLTFSGQRRLELMETEAGSGQAAPAPHIMPSLSSGHTLRPCLLGSDARGSCGHYIPCQTRASAGCRLTTMRGVATSLGRGTNMSRVEMSGRRAI